MCGCPQRPKEDIVILRSEKHLTSVLGNKLQDSAPSASTLNAVASL